MTETRTEKISEDSLRGKPMHACPESELNGIPDQELNPDFRALALEYFKPVIERFCQEDVFPLKSLVNIFERAVLIESLSMHNGNQKRTADFLGLKLTTLNEKIKKHGIQFRKEPY